MRRRAVREISERRRHDDSLRRPTSAVRRRRLVWVPEALWQLRLQRAKGRNQLLLSDLLIADRRIHGITQVLDDELCEFAGLVVDQQVAPRNDLELRAAACAQNALVDEAGAARRNERIFAPVNE